MPESTHAGVIVLQICWSTYAGMQDDLGSFGEDHEVNGLHKLSLQYNTISTNTWASGTERKDIDLHPYHITLIYIHIKPCDLGICFINMCLSIQKDSPDFGRRQEQPEADRQMD